MKKAVIVSGFRTAIGKHLGQWKKVPPEDMAAVCMKEAVARIGIDPMEIEDVAFGNIMGQYGSLGRVAALRAGLPFESGAVTIDRQCGSGSTAIAFAALNIMAGNGDVYIAAGVENMTLIPYQMAKTTELQWDSPKFLRTRLAPEDISENLSMPETADRVAAIYGTSREECDDWAAISHQRAVRAIKDGVFKDQIVPFEITSRKGTTIIDADECPRADTTKEGLSKLPPLFKGGVTTAGNSCPRSDGAGALVMMSEEKALALGLKPLLAVKSFAVAGVDPKIMGIGPIPSTLKALQRAGLTVDELDVIEMNEAFAAQFVTCMKELRFKPEKVNPNGGAIALGHPLGGTGVVLTVKLMYEMLRNNSKYGLVTMCIGGGQGMATVFERY